MSIRSRFNQLVKKVGALRRQSEDEHDAEHAALLDTWEAGGCKGPLPPAGPCPRKYTKDQWRGIHRLMCGMILRDKGLPLPADFTEEERRDIEKTDTTFGRIDPDKNFPPRMRAELAPYGDVIEQFISDPGGGIVPPDRQQEGQQEAEPAPIPDAPTPQPEPPKGPTIHYI